MKMFKKILACVLLAAMALTVMTGCANSKIIKESIYKQITSVYSNIKYDAALEEKAEKFVQVFAAGDNLESNKEAGIAYAKVSRDEEEFWNLMKSTTDVVMPVWYRVIDDLSVNAGLMMMCNDSSQVVSSLVKSQAFTCLGEEEYTKVGVALVNIKGDTYCVIIASK